MAVPLEKKQIHIDAWLAKKYMVLLKRKLQRGQVPRSGGFRLLMAAVYPDRFAGMQQAMAIIKCFSPLP